MLKLKLFLKYCCSFKTYVQYFSPGDLGMITYLLHTAWPDTSQKCFFSVYIWWICWSRKNLSLHIFQEFLHLSFHVSKSIVVYKQNTIVDDSPNINSPSIMGTYCYDKSSICGQLLAENGLFLQHFRVRNSRTPQISSVKDGNFGNFLLSPKVFVSFLVSEMFSWPGVSIIDLF